MAHSISLICAERKPGICLGRMLAVATTVGTLRVLATSAVLFFCAGVTLADDEIRVGIISPKGGVRASPVGLAHEHSVLLALDRLGPIHIGDREIRLISSARDDEGDAQKSALLAEELADKGVVAILGPVNSSATKAVLQALQRRNRVLPVISGWSTAPELTAPGKRDANFFRLIFHDGERMAQYERFLRHEIDEHQAQRYLVLYQDDEYGRGLKESLEERLRTGHSAVLSWCEIVVLDCKTSAEDRVLGREHLEAIGTDLQFQPTVTASLQQERADNVLLLGPITGALAIAKGLREQHGVGNKFFFVGSSRQFLDEAPMGSYTIGDPILDPDHEASEELRDRWQRILDAFAKHDALERGDFVITAYEAALTLHEALRRVLRENPSVAQDIDSLRRKLRDELEDGTFSSLEPWRKIKFQGGQLVETPTAPVYQVSRVRNRKDAGRSAPWVDLDVPTKLAYLERPLEVRLRGHGVSSVRVQVSRANTDFRELIEERLVQLPAGQAVERFHLVRPGNYTVQVSGTNGFPDSADVSVRFSVTYALSAVTALIAAVLMLRTRRRGIVPSMNRVAFGLLMGLALTFMSVYGKHVTAAFPFPSFGDEPIVNAVIAGFVGGLLNPYLVAAALVRWASGIALYHHRPSEPAKA